MTEDTIFDAASLTKVLATAPCIMLLWERGQVRLDEPVVTYIPEFEARDKEKITIRHLLTHTSGLNPGLSRNPDWNGYEKAIALACAEKPTDPPGIVFRYSDINFIVLGEVVQRVSGIKLNEFAARELFEPLGMKDTCYLPAGEPSWRALLPPNRSERGAARRCMIRPRNGWAAWLVMPACSRRRPTWPGWPGCSCTRAHRTECRSSSQTPSG